MKTEIIRIKASAGSGKTYQLALRYLKLLKKLKYPGPQNLRKIVAITFTNKAAWEMKDRIVRFLKEIVLNTEAGQNLAKDTSLSPEEATAWLETILQNYSDFYVRTIDSLLFTILKGLSFELGIKPDLTVLFETRQLYDTAFDKVLANLEDNQTLWEQALDTFLKIDQKKGFYPESALKYRLTELIPKIHDEIETINIAEISSLKNQLECIKDEFCTQIASLSQFLNGNLIKGITPDIEVDKLSDRSILSKDIEKIFKKKARVSQEEKARLDKLRKRLREKLEEWKLMNAISRVSGYVPLLKELKKISQKICEQEGIAPGSDWWTDTILDVIKEEDIPPLIYAHFASKFTHFLFDEFQDTSRQQWEALYPLLEESASSGGTIFLVGDIKQAIYRWRGGDWHLFQDVFSQNKYFAFIDKNSFQEQTLQFNYRSHPALVNFFNTIFAPLADEDTVYKTLSSMVLGNNSLDNVKKEFAQNVAAAFSDYKQIPARNSTDINNNIKIYQVSGSKDETRQAIKNSLLKNIKLEWEKRKQSDQIEIAVLVRKHDTGEEISSWLIQEGIPVITENALRLKVSSVVKGILCFLSYLYEPDDQRALYGILSTGILDWGPRDEQELYKLWIKNDIVLWKTRLDALIEELKPLVNRRAPYELIQILLKKTNLSKRLENELISHKVFVERLLEVTHYFEVESGPGLGNYLTFWEQGGLEEQVGFPENINAVRVLTIHKAKGLEFPVVFIPFLDWRIKNYSPVTTYKNYLIQLKKDISEELELLRQRERSQEAQELLNLFYVAVTRAKEYLYLYLDIGNVRGSKPLVFWINKIFKECNLPCPIKHLK